MRVIESIEIKNFQSHAHTIIEPAAPGELTCIIGTTDSGKSALFRALRWIYFGGPVAPRTGTSHTSASLTFSDGTVVTRERSGSTNRYIVSIPGHDPQVFEGFRNQIPYEVQKALGVRAVDVSGMTIETNIARQLEPAFLGSAVSSPARAKVLGHIAGIEAVDMAVRSAGRDLLDGQLERKRLDQQIDELNSEIERYDYLPELGRRIEAAEKLYSAIVEYTNRRDKLVALRSKLTDIQETGKRVQLVIRQTQGASESLARIESAARLMDQATRLSGAKHRLSGLDHRSKQLLETLQETSGYEETLAVIGTAADTVAKRDRLLHAKSSLERHANRVEQLTQVIAQNEHGEYASQLVAKGSNLVERINRLKSIKSALDKTSSQIDDARKKLERTKTADDVVLKVSSIQSVLEQLTRLRNAKSTLATLRQQEQSAIGRKELAQSDIQRCHELETKLFRELGHCPFCGSDTTNHTHLKEAV